MESKKKYQADVAYHLAAAIAELLRISRQNLKAAFHLASPPNRLALSLCEKAAANLIRAVLASEGKLVGFTATLEDLVEPIPDVNPLKAKLREIQDLSSFVLGYQHSTPTGQIPPPPDRSVFGSYLDKVKSTLNEAATRFGVDLGLESNTPARFPEPIR